MPPRFRKPQAPGWRCARSSHGRGRSRTIASCGPMPSRQFQNINKQLQLEWIYTDFEKDARVCRLLNLIACPVSRRRRTDALATVTVRRSSRCTWLVISAQPIHLVWGSSTRPGSRSIKSCRSISSTKIGLWYIPRTRMWCGEPGASIRDHLGIVLLLNQSLTCQQCNNVPLSVLSLITIRP